MNIIDPEQIKNTFHGSFLAEPLEIQAKLFKVKAFVFDWDGVFNNGAKDEVGSSPFNEIDSMGTNMLRFNYYLRKGQNPVTAVVSGEKNNAAFVLAKREHFHAVYYNIRNKKDSFLHLCTAHDIQPHEVAYFFDDVLDLPIAELCGLRIMISRECNPLLLDLVERYNLADYITAADGGHNGLREAIELLMGLSERYDDTIMERVRYSEHYQQYIQSRNIPVPAFYTATDSKITEQQPQ